MTVQWEDTTSYSRGERGKREPNAWTLRLLNGQLRVSAHGLHGRPGIWFVSCHQVQIDTVQLKATTAEEARQEALAVVRLQVARFASALDEAARLDAGQGGKTE